MPDGRVNNNRDRGASGGGLKRRRSADETLDYEIMSQEPSTQSPTALISVVSGNHIEPSGD
jgi:hypothetical protein